MIRQFIPSYTVVSEDQATALATREAGYPVQVLPPDDHSPATIEPFIRSVMELQTKWFGLRNTSPCLTFELRRPHPDQLTMQYVVPTARLERKVRTQLSTALPGVGFRAGDHGLPIAAGDSVGGGFLTPGRPDWYPFQTEFSAPPLNGVVASLHRHAMRDTRFIIQILFQPSVGRSLRQWWWTRRGLHTCRFLRKENDELWKGQSPSPRQRAQASLVEQKVGSRRFWAAIRIAVIGAGEFTPSRLKELAGGFNVFEHPVSGQYMNLVTMRRIRTQPFLSFARAVADRRFGGSSLRFHASPAELAGLVSIPDRIQQNLSA